MFYKKTSAYFVRSYNLCSWRLNSSAQGSSYKFAYPNLCILHFVIIKWNVIILSKRGMGLLEVLPDLLHSAPEFVRSSQSRNRQTLTIWKSLSGLGRGEGDEEFSEAKTIISLCDKYILYLFFILTLLLIFLWLCILVWIQLLNL